MSKIENRNLTIQTGMHIYQRSIQQNERQKASLRRYSRDQKERIITFLYKNIKLTTLKYGILLTARDLP